MAIKLEQLSKSWSGEILYDHFSFTFEENRITGLMGASGSGKTTLLNMIAGIVPPDNGCISGISSNQIAYIFQEDRLLPWRTVRENVTFVLKEPNNRKVDEVLKALGILDVADAYPKSLSGGMRKRVAIARAFCYPASLLLMDEPFSGLDKKLKYKIMNDLKKLWEITPKTIIFVSHNQDELEFLCSEIYELTGKPVRLKQLKEKTE